LLFSYLLNQVMYYYLLSLLLNGYMIEQETKWHILECWIVKSIRQKNYGF